ncbi:unnamed protein product [Durusdinium trenchii]|uniref:Casein kinase I n=1 Tax=Durusdinium trenchii TaxID=1381693 RepID=A0ABP0K591_9DINO
MPWTEIRFDDKPDSEEQKFYLGKRLGNGSFGQVFLAKNRRGKELAVKVEMSCRSSLLFSEAHLLKKIAAPGFPKVHHVASEGGFNMLAMDLLGPSLDALFQKCGRRFSLKTLLMLAAQMLDRLAYLHSKEYCHRDVKPENFLIGLGERCNVVHLIDFGLSKKRRDKPRAEQKSLTGTTRYASTRAHRGADQGYGDDLESLGYVLAYFLRGKLPWQGLDADTKEAKHAKIAEMKHATSAEELFEGSHPVFVSYMRCVKNFKFEDIPNYRQLRRSFTQTLAEEGFEDDGDFDWLLPQEQLGGRTFQGRLGNRVEDISMILTSVAILAQGIGVGVHSLPPP